MQPTYKCRYGTNLFVFDGETKVKCGVCGETSELPAAYGQTSAPQISRESASKSFQAFPKKIRSLQQRWKPWILVLSGVILAAVGSSVVIQSRRNHSNYIKGESAYRNANCAVAIDYLKAITRYPHLFNSNNYFEWAQPKLEECNAFTSQTLRVLHGNQSPL